jgi:hypothetical protein
MRRFVQVSSNTVGLILIVGVSVASALILDAKTDPQKHRKDVGKRGAKHIQCLVKVATKCEKKGANSGVECHVDTGVVDYAGDTDLDPKNKQPAKFQADIAKCDDKYDPAKKGTDYQAIGCPGDCDGGTDGIQQCTDMATYKASVISTDPGTAKDQLPLLATLIDGACANNLTLAPASTDPAMIDCVTDQAAALTKYTKFLGKCYEKCENDYKAKKGDGGGNDDPKCLVDDPGVDAVFQQCRDDALAKAQKKITLIPEIGPTLGIIDTALNDANDGLYNRFDPVIGPVAGSDPCGTCGNGTREGAEECDLADDVLCGGPCNTDCTCP